MKGKKKIAIVLLTAALGVTILAGCEETEPPTPSETNIVSSKADTNPQTSSIASDTQNSSNPQNKSNFDEKEVIKNLAITEYQYDNRFSHYQLLVIKNNSKFDLNIDISGVFKDASGSMIGTSTTSEDAFESGQEMIFALHNDEVFEKCDYEISVKEEPYFAPVLSNLKLETNTTKDKVVASVTNNGEKPAKFVEMKALFFNEDKVVGYGTTYCVDGDHEIKPGKTEHAEKSCYETFDSVKVYLSGRAER